MCSDHPLAPSPIAERAKLLRDPVSQNATLPPGAESAAGILAKPKDETFDSQAALTDWAQSVRCPSLSAVVGTTGPTQTNQSSLSLRVNDGHTALNGPKVSPETSRQFNDCKEENTEVKTSQSDTPAFREGRRPVEVRERDRDRDVERSHVFAARKDRERHRHYREREQRSRERYGHGQRLDKDGHLTRERSLNRERHYRERSVDRYRDRHAYYRRDHHYHRKRDREDRNWDRDRDRDWRYQPSSYDAHSRSSGHHHRDGGSSHWRRTTEDGRDRWHYSVEENGSRVKPSPSRSITPTSRHSNKKRSLSDDGEASEECKTKKHKKAKKKKNKDKHRWVLRTKLINRSTGQDLQR